MKNHKISLDSLALKEYPVLLDTSALIDYYTQNRDLETLTEKFAKAKEGYDFFVLMKNYVQNGSNFYITSLVSEELKNGYSPSFKKGIKRVRNSIWLEILIKEIRVNKTSAKKNGK